MQHHVMSQEVKAGTATADLWWRSLCTCYLSSNKGNAHNLKLLGVMTVTPRGPPCAHSWRMNANVKVMKVVLVNSRLGTFTMYSFKHSQEDSMHLNKSCLLFT